MMLRSKVMAKRPKTLNDRQKRFAQEYLVDRNATAAAKRAGYSPRSAYSQGQRLLKHDEVGKLIEASTKRVEKKLGVKAEDVIRGLTVEALGQGPNTTASARVRAWELLGRYLGVIVDKHEQHTHIHLETPLSDDQLAKRLRDRASGIRA